MTGNVLHLSRSRNFFRRGAILLEVTLALAIFVVAGAAILSLVGQATTAFQAARDKELLADLARSALSQIEAGIARPETLNGPVPAWPASVSDGESALDGAGGGGVSASSGSRQSEWELRISTAPTETTGIVMVSVQAVRLNPDESVRGTFTLRQAVAIRDGGD